MSTPFGNHPFAAPHYPEPKPGAVPDWAGEGFAFEYVRSVQYVFDTPSGVNNVLLTGLCLLSTLVVPALGNIILLGYFCLVTEDLLATAGHRHRDFDFNHLDRYLQRCVPPLVVALVGIAVIGAALGVFYLCAGLTAAAIVAVAGDAAGVLLLGLLPPVLICLFVGSLIAHGVLAGMILRAALLQDIGEGFRLAWAWDFFQRTKWEQLLTALFLWLASLLAGLLGLLACVVGVFFTSAVLCYAYAFFSYQLYRLYLSRGGEPVAIKAFLEPVKT